MLLFLFKPLSLLGCVGPTTHPAAQVHRCLASTYFFFWTRSANYRQNSNYSFIVYPAFAIYAQLTMPAFAIHAAYNAWKRQAYL
jgi:hypothetical protein